MSFSIRRWVNPRYFPICFNLLLRTMLPILKMVLGSPRVFNFLGTTHIWETFPYSVPWQASIGRSNNPTRLTIQQIYFFHFRYSLRVFYAFLLNMCHRNLASFSAKFKTFLPGLSFWITCNARKTSSHRRMKFCWLWLYIVIYLAERSIFTSVYCYWIWLKHEKFCSL